MSYLARAASRRAARMAACWEKEAARLEALRLKEVAETARVLVEHVDRVKWCLIDYGSPVIVRMRELLAKKEGE